MSEGPTFPLTDEAWAARHAERASYDAALKRATASPGKVMVQVYCRLCSSRIGEVVDSPSGPLFQASVPKEWERNRLRDRVGRRPFHIPPNPVLIEWQWAPLHGVERHRNPLGLYCASHGPGSISRAPLRSAVATFRRTGKRQRIPADHPPLSGTTY